MNILDHTKILEWARAARRHPVQTAFLLVAAALIIAFFSAAKAAGSRAGEWIACPQWLCSDASGSDVQAGNPQVELGLEPQPVLEFAYCLGRGRQLLEGVEFWGPYGTSCRGPNGEDWGEYDGARKAITELGACIGDGGVLNLKIWGPVGEECGVENGDWGTLGDANLHREVIDISGLGIAACYAQGTNADGMLIWGPFGEHCGGNSDWGTYNEFATMVNHE